MALISDLSLSTSVSSNAIFVFVFTLVVSLEDLADHTASVGAEEDSDWDSCSGPRVARTTGRTTSPWYNPNTTVKVNALKNVLKTCPLETAPSDRARKVVRPPLRTAGPMVIRALMVLSSLSPAGSFHEYPVLLIMAKSQPWLAMASHCPKWPWPRHGQKWPWPRIWRGGI